MALKTDDRENAIELRAVSKVFGTKRAVDEATLAIPTGSVYGLIGPNGAGKTTTFSMLAGYLEPTDGDVFVLDHRPGAVDALKGRIGVLPQDALLPANEPVGEFLHYLARLQGIPDERASKAVDKALKEVEGIGWLTQKCGSLSHGMAKRVGIAQAFLGDPEIVLLDEPTAGLDPKVAYEIRQIIKGKKGTCTLVISSHNLQELEEICDHAAILDHGRVIVAGTMENLTASTQQVRIMLGQGPIPQEELRSVPGVKSVGWDSIARELTIIFDPQAGDAEDMIAQLLPVLLAQKARISGVAKGQRLEKKVMELTE